MSLSLEALHAKIDEFGRAERMRAYCRARARRVGSLSRRVAWELRSVAYHERAESLRQDLIRSWQ